MTAEEPPTRARLRVNLEAREFEVEGSETFVRGYATRIEALLDRLGRPPAPSPAPPPALADTPTSEEPLFGERLQALPRSATDVDRVLLAGLHLQQGAVDRWFATSDANRLLLEHGVKLGNPSQSVKQNLLAKRAFAVQRGRYRVAQVGIDHLEQLSGQRLSES